MTVIAIPPILQERLTPEGAKVFIDLLNRLESDVQASTIKASEEKFEKRLAEETAQLDRRITEEVARLDKRITEEISKVRVDIANTRANLIKWTFIFIFGHFLATLATHLILR